MVERGLLRTLESMATPCSVKAWGKIFEVLTAL
jgi:hypothetical protein